MNWQR